ncbi:MAG: hypothetical protein ACSLFK_14790 [Gemmatimonadaceae bacterium]
MSSIIRYVLLAVAFAVATWGLGWWSVPLVAALWGFFSSDFHRARNAALAAAGGWASLLLLDAARGPVGAMAGQLGELMNLPTFALYLVTLLFPALLAWSAAAVMRRPDPALPDSAPPASS